MGNGLVAVCFALLILILVSIILSGPYLPTNAYKVKNLGNNWYSFCLDQKRYMYHEIPGRHSSESTTRVSEEDFLCK